MDFSQLAHKLHKFRINRRESTAMCVKILTDAILDDVAMESLGRTSGGYQSSLWKIRLNA